MQSVFFSLLFFLFPKLCIAQLSSNDKKIYLDSTFNESVGISNRVYSMRYDGKNPNRADYRIIKDYYSNKKLYVFNDYYKSGALYTTGTSSRKDIVLRDDEFISYYENGNKKKAAIYIQGSLDGVCTEWYENGNKRLEQTFLKYDEFGKAIFKINRFWNIGQEQKVIRGNGQYEESSEKYFGAGKVKKGFKSGVWEGWIRIPENKYSEIYESGKLVSGKIVDENNIQTTYNSIESRAQPKKGFLHFYKYLKKNIDLPNRFKNTIRGIYLEFTINEEGKIVAPKIINPTNPEADSQAPKVLMSYENWIPAEQRGQKTTQVSWVTFSSLTLEHRPAK